MRREVFIKKMLQLGEELSNSNQPITISMIINDAEKLCDKYESELKKLRVADVSGEVCDHPYEYLSFGEDCYCECEKCNTRLS